MAAIQMGDSGQGCHPTKLLKHEQSCGWHRTSLEGHVHFHMHRDVQSLECKSRLYWTSDISNCSC